MEEVGTHWLVAINAARAKLRRVARVVPPVAVNSAMTLAYWSGDVTTVRLSQFLEAERTMVGPPMSIISMQSSKPLPLATVCVHAVATAGARHEDMSATRQVQHRGPLPKAVQNDASMHARGNSVVRAAHHRPLGASSSPSHSHGHGKGPRALHTAPTPAKPKPQHKENSPA